MGEWQKVQVKDVCSLIVDCVNRTAPIIDYETPYRMIRTTNIRDGRIDLSDARFVTEDVFRTWTRRAPVIEGDVILTREAPIGEVGFVKGLGEVFLGQRTVQYRANPRIVVPRYLFYAFRSPGMQHQFQSHEGSGSVVSHIKVADCHKFQVLLAPYNEQICISELLGSLDDKIDLNRQMNETLEAMARAIFKDWFVDFGPTRAKMEGRTPYLAPEIWSLFPNRLDDEGKPEGWAVSAIGQEVEIFGGSTPSTKNSEFWNGEIAWATPKDLSSLSAPVLLDTERKITEDGLTQISSGLLPVGTVLLSSRAPIGYLAITEIPVAVNQGFIAMVCNKAVSNVFVWLWTKANTEEIMQRANGSTFLEISKSNFRPLPVTMPSNNLLTAFDGVVKPLFERIVSNERESKSLIATRDFLLPKLMSGEIRVRDAEKALEAVA